MADVRTEREKLVEALRNRGWRCYKSGAVCESAYPDEQAMWCPGCLLNALAAADLLSEEGEPDCYLVEIQRLDGEWRKVPVPYGRDPRFSDLWEAKEEAEAYRADGIPVRVRALYPGPVLDAAAHEDRNPEEVRPGTLEARGYER